jgi:hypothetical protein
LDCDPIPDSQTLAFYFLQEWRSRASNDLVVARQRNVQQLELLLKFPDTFKARQPPDWVLTQTRAAFRDFLPESSYRLYCIARADCISGALLKKNFCKFFYNWP